MKIKDLKEQIHDLPDDMEVMIRSHWNPGGNITAAREAQETEYGFLGEAIPCIVIEPEIDEDFCAK